MNLKKKPICLGSLKTQINHTDRRYIPITFHDRRDRPGVSKNELTKNFSDELINYGHSDLRLQS